VSPAYPSDLTDAQWAIFAPWIPPAKLGGRPRRHPDRALINAMLYVLRGGIAWRALPDRYPPWPTVSFYFRRWQRDGTWERMNMQLRAETRVRAGRRADPSAAILDSQSATTTEKGGPPSVGQADGTSFHRRFAALLT